MLQVHRQELGFDTFPIPGDDVHALLDARLKENKVQGATGRAQL